MTEPRDLTPRAHTLATIAETTAGALAILYDGFNIEHSGIREVTAKAIIETTMYLHVQLDRLEDCADALALREEERR